MAKGAAGGGAVKTALVVTGGLVLAWLTVESAFKPFLDRLRAAGSRSTDPARDPDEDTAAPAPAPEEDKSPVVAAAVASAVAEEKEPAVAAADPSAPPLPAEAVESEEKGAAMEAELGEKGEAASKAE